MSDIRPDLMEDAQRRFARLYNVRDMLSRREGGAVCAGRLYAHVLGGEDGRVESLLKSDLAVRRTYRTLLQKSALVHMKQAVAASSQAYPERHAQGWRLRLQVSRAQSDQLYLILEMNDQRGKVAQTLHMFGPDDTIVRLALPAARNGVIQTIIDKESDVARLLAEPKTEIFLR